MHKELHRLATFSDWQGNTNVSPLRLARNGFYYLSPSDESVCFSCDLRISRGIDQQNPLEQHRHLSPNCALITGTEARNIPLTPSVLEPPNVASEHLRNAPNDSIDGVLRSALNRANAKELFSTPNSTYRVDRNNPDFLQLRHETVRLGTFHDWPSTSNATPSVLAREGFFYTGVEDKVQCAFCQGCLKRWQPTDVPSQEHWKHYPKCPFVRGLDVGNVSASACSSAVRTTSSTTTLTTGDQRLLTTPEGFNLGSGERNYASRLAQEPRLSPQGVHRSNEHVKELIGLEQRMSATAVRAVLNMGFSHDLVKRTIEKRLSTTGQEFADAESLLEAIFQEGQASHLQKAGLTSTVSSSSTSSQAAAANTAAVEVVPTSSSAESSAGLTSVMSRNSWKDSGIFSISSSSASLPPIWSGRQAPLINPSLSSTLVSASVNSESKTLTPVEPAASSASDIIPMATIPEVGTSFLTKLKAKRKRNRRKIPLSKTSANNEEAMIREEGKEAAEEEEQEAASNAGADSEALKYLEENRQLREARTCKVCMDSEVDTVFLPCGHLVCCHDCSPQLRSCPICRTFIRGTVKTSLS